MSLTYYVALPFVEHETGIAPGQAQECSNEASAMRRAEAIVAPAAKRWSARLQENRRPEYGQLWRCHDFKDLRRGARKPRRIVIRHAVDARWAPFLFVDHSGLL